MVGNCCWRTSYVCSPCIHQPPGKQLFAALLVRHLTRLILFLRDVNASSGVLPGVCGLAVNSSFKRKSLVDRRVPDDQVV